MKRAFFYTRTLSVRFLLKFFAFSIILAGAFLTYSCREQVDEEPVGNMDLTIANAKVWVESELSSNRSGRTGVASIKKHLNWEEAFLNNSENDNAVVVPFDYDGGLAMNIGTVDDAKSGKSKIRKSTNRILVFKKGDKFESQIIRSYPTRSHVGGYSGDIRIYDMNENFIGGYRYQEGKPTKVYTPTEKGARTNLVCGTQCQVLWTCYPMKLGQPDSSPWMAYGDEYCHFPQELSCEHVCDYGPGWNGGVGGTIGSAGNPAFLTSTVPSLPVISDQAAKDIANEMMRFQDTTWVHILDQCDKDAVYNYALAGRQAEIEWKKDMHDCLSNAGIGVLIIQAIKSKDIMKALTEIFNHKQLKGKAALRSLLFDLSLGNIVASICISDANDKFEMALKQANATYRQDMRSCFDNRE